MLKESLKVKYFVKTAAIPHQFWPLQTQMHVSTFEFGSDSAVYNRIPVIIVEQPFRRSVLLFGVRFRDSDAFYHMSDSFR